MLHSIDVISPRVSMCVILSCLLLLCGWRRAVRCVLCARRVLLGCMFHDPLFPCVHVHVRRFVLPLFLLSPVEHRTSALPFTPTSTASSHQSLTRWNHHTGDNNSNSNRHTQAAATHVMHGSRAHPRSSLPYARLHVACLCLDRVSGESVQDLRTLLVCVASARA